MNTALVNIPVGQLCPNDVLLERMVRPGGIKKPIRPESELVVVGCIDCTVPLPGEAVVSQITTEPGEVSLEGESDRTQRQCFVW